MKIAEKVNYLQDNHLGEWLKTRSEVEGELSEKQSMFCVCRQLASGLHESSCRKFADKVNKTTARRLEYLIKEKPDAN